MPQSKIFKKIKETKDTFSFRFEKPVNFDYKPGQYCIFKHREGDEIISRSYSLSSSPTEDFLQITVKHVPDGKMSTFLCEKTKEGDLLNFEGPMGDYVFDEKIQKNVFVAGGVGITPFRCIIKYVMDKKLKNNIILIYGSQNPENIIFKDFVEKCNEEENINLFLTIDEEAEEWHNHVGFIDLEFIKEATNNKLDDKVFYLTGPPPMIIGIKVKLMKEGIKEENIKIDAW